MSLILTGCLSASRSCCVRHDALARPLMMQQCVIASSSETEMRGKEISVREAVLKASQASDICSNLLPVTRCLGL
jgi:hypothetical protein